MRNLSLRRGYVLNLSAKPVEIRPGIWMCGLRHLLERVRLGPRHGPGVLETVRPNRA
jgi:hypothetical protein